MVNCESCKQGMILERTIHNSILILHTLPMHLQRLRGRKICERVLKRGMLVRGQTMHMRVLLGTPKHPHADAKNPALYIGTIASLKLDKSAVKRNRMRRRCREAWRIAMRDVPWPLVVSFQLLIMPRSSSLKAPFPEIQKDVSRFLTTLRSWPIPSVATRSSISS